jgi:hypothetical protein
VAPDSACGREGLAAGPPRGGQRGVYAILGAAFIVGTALLFGLGARIKPGSPRPRSAMGARRLRILNGR